jgi:predicted O-methyltransferase YrrM
MDLFNLNPKLLKYIEEHSTAEDEVLADLRRQTFLKVVHPRMISGPVQGKFLHMISSLIQAENILEIGTYTGYSAICMARGMKENGRLITLEVNDELEKIQDKYFRLAGLSDRIRRITGDAREIIPNLNENFDLVFIDADKEQYPEYYQMVKPKLRKGGLIIADNVLWDGKVIDDQFRNDRPTQSIKKFNTLINKDKELENLLLPLRDGLMLIRKL